jgi:TRAP-type C4-dicarboxylate transport system permease large subunit
MLDLAPQMGLSRDLMRYQFGVMIVFNLCIGLCTPPVGTCLFLASSVGNTTISRVVPRAIPFFIAMTVALLLITYIPWISLWLPRRLGL